MVLIPNAAGRPLPQNAPLQRQEASPAEVPSASPAPVVAQPHDQMAVSQSGGAETSISLVDDKPAVSRRPRPQRTQELQLPASTDEIRQAGAALFEQHGRYEMEQLMGFLRTYADLGAGRVPRDQQNMLEAIPAKLRSQLPEVRAMLEAQFAGRELIRVAQRQPEDIEKMLNCLNAIVEHGEGLDSRAYGDLVAAERAKLPPQLQAQFDTLGLSRTSFQPWLKEVYAQTRGLNQVFEKFSQHQVSVQIAGMMLPGINTTPDMSRDKALMMAELATLIPDLNAIDTADRDGIAPLLVLAKSLDPGCAELLQQMMRHALEQGGDKVNFRDFHPQVDLKSGHVALLLNLLQKGPGLTAYTDLLAKAADPEQVATLTGPEKTKLAQLGIGVDTDGELRNLISDERIVGEDMNTLKQFAHQLLRGQQTGIQESTVMATGVAAQWTQAFLQDTGLALQLESELKAGETQLNGLFQQVEVSKTEIHQAQTEVVEAQTSYENIRTQTQAAQALQPFLADGGLHLDAIEQAGQIPALNTALKPLGFEVQRDAQGGWKVSIPHYQIPAGGNPETELNRFLATKLTLLQGSQDRAWQRLQAAQTRLAQAQAKGEKLAAELERALASQQSKADSFGEVLDRLKAYPTDRLRAMLQDPAFRAGQSPEILKQLEACVKQSERLQHEGPQLLARFGRQLQQGKSNLEAFRQVLAQSARVLATSHQAPPPVKGLDKLMPSPASAQAQQLARLLEEADKLEATLQLAPTPISPVVDDWRESLEQTRLAIEQKLAQEQNAQTAERQQETRFLLHLKENLAYHTRQLERLDQRQHERVITALRQSLEQVRSLANP